MLQRVLSPGDFERWEQLTLQRTLDTMPGGLALPACNLFLLLPHPGGGVFSRVCLHALCQLHRVLNCLLSHFPLRPADAAYCPRCSTLSLEDEDSCAQVSASGKGGSWSCVLPSPSACACSERCNAALQSCNPSSPLCSAPSASLCSARCATRAGTQVCSAVDGDAASGQPLLLGWLVCHGVGSYILLARSHVFACPSKLVCRHAVRVCGDQAGHAAAQDGGRQPGSNRGLAAARAGPAVPRSDRGAQVWQVQQLILQCMLMRHSAVLSCRC